MWSCVRGVKAGRVCACGVWAVRGKKRLQTEQTAQRAECSRTPYRDSVASRHHTSTPPDRRITSTHIYSKEWKGRKMKTGNKQSRGRQHKLTGEKGWSENPRRQVYTDGGRREVCVCVRGRGVKAGRVCVRVAYGLCEAKSACKQNKQPSVQSAHVLPIEIASPAVITRAHRQTAASRAHTYIVKSGREER